MDVELVTRVVIIAAAGMLAVALVVLGPSSMPHRRRPRGPRRRLTGRRVRVDATNLMSYVAASMAVALGGALAITH